jgi:hypothetical protein
LDPKSRFFDKDPQRELTRKKPKSQEGEENKDFSLKKGWPGQLGEEKK